MARRAGHVKGGDAVTETLRSYATRGVFSEFSERKLPRGRAEYRFRWITQRSIHAIYDSKTRVFKLVDLLPEMSLRSTMDKAFRDFLLSRRSSKLAKHRRFSGTLIRTVRCTHKKNQLTLSLTLHSRRTEEATRHVVHLISEIFQNFLAGPYHDYMVKNFGIRED
jgi:hypothetical protein